jgi:2-polyprenyl-3-methyl-5-hydroxy-6-metoxy-1,4-benzoquinol methylase
MSTGQLRLTAKMEAFDSFWEAPENVDKGYKSFGIFYRHNYLKYFPEDREANILDISCGPGYMVQLLNSEGYANVLGIDSIEEKIETAIKRNLNCISDKAFELLGERKDTYDVIFCEQEINHLTKDEILVFLDLCFSSLRANGIIIFHSLNGANPIVGSENLALNFDHYNTFTEQSLAQILSYTKFCNIKVFPLKLYVFYKNPVNYIGIILDALISQLLKLGFIFYGKKNKIFSKKIGAIGQKV